MKAGQATVRATEGDPGLDLPGRCVPKGGWYCIILLALLAFVTYA